MTTPQQPDLSKEYVRAQEFRAYIEKEIMIIIQKLFSSETITPERLQDIARHALYSLPKGVKIDELYRSAVQMSEGYSELAPVVIKIMTEYENAYNGQAVAEVSDLIKKGSYDKAQDMVMNVLKYKGI